MRGGRRRCPPPLLIILEAETGKIRRCAAIVRRRESVPRLIGLLRGIGCARALERDSVVVSRLGIEWVCLEGLAERADGLQEGPCVEKGVAQQVERFGVFWALGENTSAGPRRAGGIAEG